MIKIGTNFDYKAPFFLDARQYVEIPEGKTYNDVLHDWDTPIPDGFEVFCGGKWWTYGESNPITVTGKFRLRTGGGGEQPHLSLTITSPTGSGLYIPYNTHLTSIMVGWSVKYGEEYLAPTSLTILLNGTSYSVSNPEATGTYEITDTNIVGGNQLKVTASFESETDEKTVTFVKTYKKYWGSLPDATISNLSGLNLISNSTSVYLKETFDCTGGKYPYYVIPKVLYESVENTFKMKVNGWENTAYTVSELVVGNGNELETYSVIRHDIIQTGVMEITFSS